MSDREADYFKNTLNTLNEESDRGSAIISASLADEVLKSMIRARLIPSLKNKDELFDISYAPLSTFSAKIDFAYRIGIITTRLKTSLHLVRRMRNEFAHCSSHLSFESHVVQDRVRELFNMNNEIFDVMWREIENTEHPDIIKLLEMSKDHNKGIDKLSSILGYRGLYTLFIASLCAVLSTETDTIEQLSTTSMGISSNSSNNTN